MAYLHGSEGCHRGFKRGLRSHHEVNTNSHCCQRWCIMSGQFKDLKGKKFGRLTVIEKDHVVRTNWYWQCQCNCLSKTIVVVRGSHLTSGQTKSCGCLLGSNRLPFGQAAFNDLVLAYMRSAESKDLAFELSKEQAYKLFTSKCHYCGLSPSSVRYKGDMFFRYNGIDRANNAVGYILSNCLPCCEGCNRFKLNRNYDVFLRKVRDIYLHLKRGGILK